MQKPKPVILYLTGLILLIVSLFSCTSTPKPVNAELAAGSWLGGLHLRGGSVIPFQFEVSGDQTFGYTITLVNGPERIELSTFRMNRDTLVVPHPTFDAELFGVVQGDQIRGEFRNNARTNYNVIPFTARKGPLPTFKSNQPTSLDLTGGWKAEFVYRKRDTSLAVARFQQNGPDLQGTFLTPSGDYRYLNGVVSGDSLFLSTFDMAHAFLFKAKVQADGSLSGMFFSGDHWYESWTATRNETFKLPSPDSITWLKPGFTRLDFTFPNIEKQPVSINDPAFEGKVIVVQIMGSWCPNCRDETIFLNEFYKKNYQRGFQVIALAFEVNPDPEVALQRLAQMMGHFDLRYEVLLAGSAGPHASKSLPMLEAINSYPTTIFLDKKGLVRRIHTGFNGPATGEEYEHFVDDFTRFIDKLLEEPA